MRRTISSYIWRAYILSYGITSAYLSNAGQTKKKPVKFTFSITNSGNSILIANPGRMLRSVNILAQQSFRSFRLPCRSSSSVFPAFRSFWLFGHSGFSPVIPVNAIKIILNRESGMSGKKSLCTRDARRVRSAPCSTFDNHGKQRRSRHLCDTPLLKFQMRGAFTAPLPLEKRC